MNNKDEELKKYTKNSSINKESEEKDFGLELKTNIEAFHDGNFPEKLDKFSTILVT